MIAAIALTFPAFAQQAANPLSADARNMWVGIKGFILKAAEKMPEEHYSFRPTPEVRTYGAIVAHIADGHYLICGAERGEKKEVTVEKTRSTKAEIMNALQEFAAYCDASYDAMTDARGGGEVIKFFGRERARLSVLHANLGHDWEHYGNLVTYLRLKGLVPPSSERSK
jgi:uncharacterized damage-inducible protein DinB